MNNIPSNDSSVVIDTDLSNGTVVTGLVVAAVPITGFVTKATTETTASSNTPHLGFLDGLRAFASVYVVVFHVVWFGAASHFLNMRNTPLIERWLAMCFSQGHIAVDAFIVLSGFCLMLPVARNGGGNLIGGVGAYAQRRVRRILPPYFAALALSLVLIAPTTRLLRLADAPPDVVSGAWLGFKPGNLLSHLFLVHNLRADWVFAIDAPMWSVATEWDIYFLFALLLLPVWRRWGSAACLTAAALLGYAPHLMLPHGHNLDWACPWYLALFTLGMLGSVLAFSSQLGMVEARTRLPFGLITLLLFAVLSILSIVFPNALQENNFWLSDFLVGGSFVAMLLWYARLASQCTGVVGAARPMALRLLESRPAVALASCSYSLYLIHTPVLTIFNIALRAGHIAAPLAALLELGVGIPLTVLAAAFFARLFEKPFLNRPRHQTI